MAEGTNDKGGDAVKLIPFQRVLPEPDNNEAAGAMGVTRDGNFRKIIRCGSINYHMRDANEQRSILDIWCEMLDNLDFPIQILSHSKQLDPDAYIRQFETRLSSPRVQGVVRAMLEDHVRHQRQRVVEGKLLNREFYIVVPYKGTDKAIIERPSDYLPGVGFAREVLNKAERNEENPIDHDLIETAEIALNRRVNFIRGYLDRMRISSQPMRMKEMRNLFFEFFHPARSEEHRLQIDDWGGELFPRVIDDEV